MTTADTIAIRRTLRDGDASAIAYLHRRIYESEYGLNEKFTVSVQDGVEAAAAQGWPQRRGAVWLVDGSGDDPLLGALGLTVEGNGLGRVRWFALDASLRGRGLGRSLLAELLDEARGEGLERLELATFSELRAAARLYRDAGFRVVWEHERSDWGPTVTMQGYDLELA